MTRIGQPGANPNCCRRLGLQPGASRARSALALVGAFSISLIFLILLGLIADLHPGDTCYEGGRRMNARNPRASALILQYAIPGGWHR